MIRSHSVIPCDISRYCSSTSSSMAVEEPEIYIAILKASYDYEPQSDDEISIKEDQLLLLIEKVDNELVIS